MTVMPMPREKWTDERLDDLKGNVDDLRTEMRGGFARVDADIRELRGEMNRRFEAVDARFDALNGRLLAGFFVLLAATIGSNAAFYSLLV
jgi:hypothetical protein